MPPLNSKNGTEPSASVTVGSPPESSSADKRSLWAEIRENIKKQLGLQRYGIWFKQTELMRLDESGLVIGVPNVIIKQYLEQQYKATVRRAAGELLGPSIDVSFDVSPSLLRRARAHQRREEAASAGTEADDVAAVPPQEDRRGDKPFADECTFERLIVTDANRLPYLAALEVASQNKPRLSFLLVLGDYGVGKTALLRATHREALGNRVACRAEWVMAESWCNEFYYSLPSRTKAFRQRYRNCDMLVVDDIQFIQGKVAAQEELLYTLKSILAAGGRVVLSSTVHPRDFYEVTPALKTLLGDALGTELVMPPVAELELMVRKLAGIHGLKAGAEVFRHLAQSHSGTIRELNAAVRSLVAYAFLRGHKDKEVDFGAAKEALAATGHSRMRPPTLGDIQQVVLEAFDVTEVQLKGRSRCRSVCRARHVAMHLARELTRESLSDIRRFFGGRTHSTVKHAIQQVSTQLTCDQDVVSLVERCRKMLRCA